MRVRELIDRYLHWVDDDIDAEERTRLHRLADDVVEPVVGRQFAALLDGAAVTQLFDRVASLLGFATDPGYDVVPRSLSALG